MDEHELRMQMGSQSMAYMDAIEAEGFEEAVIALGDAIEQMKALLAEQGIAGPPAASALAGMVMGLIIGLVNE